MIATATDPASEYDKVLSHIAYLKDVVVSFDGLKALDVGEFAVHFNDLRVVIGPNGAGKTTLCDVISGKTRPRSGKVYFDRADVTHVSDVEIAIGRALVGEPRVLLLDEPTEGIQPNVI